MTIDAEVAAIVVCCCMAVMELPDDMEIVCPMLTRAYVAGPLLGMVLSSRTSGSASRIQGYVVEVIPLQPLDDVRHHFHARVQALLCPLLDVSLLWLF